MQYSPMVMIAINQGGDKPDHVHRKDTFSMKVPGVSQARMAAMEGRKAKETDEGYICKA